MTKQSLYVLQTVTRVPQRNVTIIHTSEDILVGKNGVPSKKKFKEQYPAGTRLVRRANHEVVLEA